MLRKTLIFVGIVVALVPYAGLPSDWDQAIMTGAGLLIVGVLLLARRPSDARDDGAVRREQPPVETLPDEHSDMPTAVHEDYRSLSVARMAEEVHPAVSVVPVETAAAHVSVPSNPPIGLSNESERHPRKQKPTFAERLAEVAEEEARLRPRRRRSAEARVPATPLLVEDRPSMIDQPAAEPIQKKPRRRVSVKPNDHADPISPSLG
jgi:hypothetical protein